jgi:pimeloyl-ACP methyl ester carboxylesterase
MTRLVYLHGFASSPQSSKARFFFEKFRAQGRHLEIPQLDQGDFTGLTITGQLRLIEKIVGGVPENAPVILFGSSLGGYLAALFAARHPQAVERLVLMAPAFQFPTRWRARFSREDLAAWKLRGTLPIFHYGYKKDTDLGYQIVEDAQLYEEEPDISQPALILHGLRDPVVPAAISQAYAARHPHVTLRLFDSGHELTDVLEELWLSTLLFLGTF